MEDRRVFCGWLQLDISPFKHTLMNVIKRWSWMFKEHLLNHVNQRLDTSRYKTTGQQEVATFLMTLKCKLLGKCYKAV